VNGLELHTSGYAFIFSSNYRTDYLAIPSENKENCAVPVEE